MEETTKALKKGREEADVIISTGGTSMGVGDLLKPCIERELKGTVHFGRVAMKPGSVPFFCSPRARVSNADAGRLSGSLRRSLRSLRTRWRRIRTPSSSLRCRGTQRRLSYVLSHLVTCFAHESSPAQVTFFIFVLPALRKMEGRREEQWELPRVPVQVRPLRIVP